MYNLTVEIKKDNLQNFIQDYAKIWMTDATREGKNVNVLRHWSNGIRDVKNINFLIETNTTYILSLVFDNYNTSERVDNLVKKYNSEPFIYLNKNYNSYLQDEFKIFNYFTNENDDRIITNEFFIKDKLSKSEYALTNSKVYFTIDLENTLSFKDILFENYSFILDDSILNKTKKENYISEHGKTRFIFENFTENIKDIFQDINKKINSSFFYINVNSNFIECSKAEHNITYDNNPVILNEYINVKFKNKSALVYKYKTKKEAHDFLKQYVIEWLEGGEIQ